jgi:ribosomal protein S18 acetylase RimI-like enzyme
MDIRPIDRSEIEAARQLLLAADWDRCVSDPAEFDELLQRSPIKLVAVDGADVVGFLRALTDGMANGYISMVVVAATHRRRGIGRALVETAMGSNRRMTWVLRASRSEHLVEFYGKSGFQKSEVALERPGLKEPRQ